MHAWYAAGVAPALLPAVLMLLRTKSREVVKSVLGFVKVKDHLRHASLPLHLHQLSCTAFPMLAVPHIAMPIAHDL